MASTNKSVDEYIASKAPATRRALKQVRGIIRKAMPDAEEVISYQMPAYRVCGRIALFFAGWAEHFSLYPSDDRVRAEFEDELARYDQSKGTIRFPLSEPVPASLIERIAKFKARQAAERAAAADARKQSRRAAAAKKR